MAEDLITRARAAAKARRDSGDDYVARLVQELATELEQVRAAAAAEAQLADQFKAERDALAEAVERIRELCEQARPAIGVGCLWPWDPCDGACGGHRTTGWDLDPAKVLAALDGQPREEAPDAR